MELVLAIRLKNGWNFDIMLFQQASKRRVSWKTLGSALFIDKKTQFKSLLAKF